MLVIGSTNHDYIFRLSRKEPIIPATATELDTRPGGQGVNQAIAAVRLGVRTSLVGCVGADADGTAIRARLISEGVDASGLSVAAKVHTGCAFVAINSDGTYAIITHPGANQKLQPDDVVFAINRMASGSVVLVQGELGVPLTNTAVQAASDAGLRVVIHLSPFLRLDDSTIRHASLLIMNRSQASELIGSSVNTLPQVRLAVQQVARTYAAVAIITVGSDGAVWSDGELFGDVVAPDVPVVDPEGAADSFAGAVAAALALGMEVPEVADFAVRAASITVSRPGVLSAFPTAADMASPATLRQLCEIDS